MATDFERRPPSTQGQMSQGITLALEVGEVDLSLEQTPVGRSYRARKQTCAYQ
jgi:hypothetical protein